MLRTQMALHALSRRAQVGARAGTQADSDIDALALLQSGGDLAIEKQPATVSLRPRSSNARQPANEIGFTFVGETGQMAPLVRDHEGPLERQEIADHKRLEEVGIGHALDAGSLEIEIEERTLGTSRPSQPAPERLLRLREGVS